MSLSLNCHKPLSTTSSSSCIFYLHHSTSPHTHTISKPFFFSHSKTPTSSLSLHTSPHHAPHSSKSPIFLPHLQEEHDPDDPIYNSFKTSTWVSSQNPQTEEKLYLDDEPEMGFQNIPLCFEENEEMGCCQNEELPEAEGIVGEIVHLVRNLPQNSTLKEALVEYEGRVSEKECCEVLEMLADNHLLLCCLRFFQWMRLQEPSLVTTRTCTMLFPLLGKGGMSDGLMDLFINLTRSKEFRDVHVYNATISGLLYSGSLAVEMT